MDLQAPLLMSSLPCGYHRISQDRFAICCLNHACHIKNNVWLSSRSKVNMIIRSWPPEKNDSIKHTPADVVNYCNAINVSCGAPERAEIAHKDWVKQQGDCTNHDQGLMSSIQ